MPYFDDKVSRSSKIKLVKKEKIVHKDMKIAKTINVLQTKNLWLKPSKKYDPNDIDLLTLQLNDLTGIKKLVYATWK